MVLTPSTMTELGSPAPDFSLPDLDGKIVSLTDFTDRPALLVMFICNHCPYVKHVRKELGKLYGDYCDKGLAVVGINSNDIANYPEDCPENMKKMACENDWRFPYLLDDSQETAKRYRAACTPDFFLYGARQKLVYRGQLDESRPDNGKPITGKDLRAAIDAVLTGAPISKNQKPSMGCNIKWKAGNEPDYFG
ncbi:MAG: thioredoxin family protein [Candidatus Omnitrophica bacterium]|nr:thioredoxin family protein [Candidatus Omnitrophota bacterium]